MRRRWCNFCRPFFPIAGMLVLAVSCSNGPFSSQSVEVPSQVSVSPNDTFYNDVDDSQWYLRTINAPGAWGFFEGQMRISYAARDMRKVVVSVIDGGIVAGHPDLAAVMSGDGANFVGGSAEPLPYGIPPENMETTHSAHGTHVSGLIAAVGGNGLGISGASYNGWPGPMVEIRPVVALSPTLNGGMAGYVSDIAASILYAAGADTGRGIVAQRLSPVINMSLGGDEGLSEAELLVLEIAVLSAADRDTVMVAAAGNGVDRPPPLVNEGQDGGIDYPARFPEVIAVGSVDEDEERSVFSDYGPELDLVAPGARTSDGDPITGMVSTYFLSATREYGYAAEAGTSMAAPLVAAAAALVRSANPYLTAEEVRKILRDTAVDLGESGWDREYGYGLINMEAALERAITKPYGRFSASSGTTDGTVAPQQPSQEKLEEYARAKADVTWNPDGPDRLIIIVPGETDVDAILTGKEIQVLDRLRVRDGMYVRVTVDGGTGERLLAELKDDRRVLLVTQDRHINFLQGSGS